MRWISLCLRLLRHCGLLRNSRARHSCRGLAGWWLLRIALTVGRLLRHSRLGNSLLGTGRLCRRGLLLVSTWGLRRLLREPRLLRCCCLGWSALLRIAGHGRLLGSGGRGHQLEKTYRLRPTLGATVRLCRPLDLKSALRAAEGVHGAVEAGGGFGRVSWELARVTN